MYPSLDELLTFPFEEKLLAMIALHILACDLFFFFLFFTVDGGWFMLSKDYRTLSFIVCIIQSMLPLLDPLNIEDDICLTCIG